MGKTAKISADRSAVGVGERLSLARVGAGYSQAVFGPMTGVNKKSVSNYELGKGGEPGFYWMMRVRDLTGASLDWLATGEGDRFGGPHQPIDPELLAQIIEVVEEETPGVDPVSKSRLIARLYADRIKTGTSVRDAPVAVPRRGSKSG